MNKNTNAKSQNNYSKGGGDFKFEILLNIGLLNTSPTGWTKEVNIVRWNDKDPKLDIREWDEKHERMSRGVGLNEEESSALKEMLLGTDLAEVFSI